MSHFHLTSLCIGPEATVYSVIKAGNTLSEVERFFEQFSRNPFIQDVSNLSDLLFNIIPNRHGADPAFFDRQEHDVVALPPIQGIYQFYTYSRLRLYTLRLNSHLVIVFNGEEKKGKKTQDNPALMAAWNDACGMAQAIRHVLQTTPVEATDRILPISPERKMTYVATHY